jgi:hypothetical protein
METQRRNGVDVKLAKPKAAKAAATLPEFNAQAFLDSAGIAKTVVNTGGARPSSRRARPATMSCTSNRAA